ncbi:MAG TPA: hypothetical protein VFA01_06065 [Candidatus Dormibacteraeota bacterium]|jgi:hypothetical protein|nr:hypothetical protein [Candidatus Dormibacteraeota bacterium]
MVSNTIGVELDELVATLARIKREHGSDAEYREWRKGFPKSWPM